MSPVFGQGSFALCAQHDNRLGGGSPLGSWSQRPERTARRGSRETRYKKAWQRSFLGYSFWVAPGKIVKRRVAPKALDTMKERVRAITSRNGGRSIAQVVARLRSYLMGWKAYFRLADTPQVFTDVDKWPHRRLRMLILKQQKRGTTLYRTLRARGVSDRLARAAAAHCGRWWAIATHGALKTAYPTQYFLSLGVPRLGPS